ncbi:MAG TPA: type II toxin-antitoxin system ParD family antitoxin [Isosphaeraceae bacterium]|jgi:antitoxin ParD1/3/4
METLTITLPDDRVAFLREQAQAQGSSVDAYIDGLAREAQTRAAKKRLEALLIEGLESGPAEPWTAQDMEEIEREVLEQLEAERRGR